jgi:hypothetical protein
MGARMAALDDVMNAIVATGALGTAAYGLVDITKFFGGGVSRAGFESVRTAVMPYIDVANPPGAVFGTAQIVETLRANWMNGVAKADQKAVAKSMIRLMLKPETAAALAGAAGVDPAHLRTAAEHIFQSQPLTDEDSRALGAFDVAVSASLDYGYERGDQQYRNAAKIAAAIIAMVLAFAAGWILYGDKPDGSPYWWLIAILIGAAAIPLAPVAKDLSSALQTAVKATAAIKR